MSVDHEQIISTIFNKINKKINIGVSSCLLGNKVRYNGEHSQDRIITEQLGKYVSFVPVCPEVELGMPTPREKVRLEGLVESPKMIGIESLHDWTDEMNHFAVTRSQNDDLTRISGFIFKSKSPSCGLEKVKLFRSQGDMKRIGTGLFAIHIKNTFPNLPLIEETQLSQSELLKEFLQQIIQYHQHHTLNIKPDSND